MGRLINDKRKTKFIIIGLIVAVVALAAVMFSVSVINRANEAAESSGEETEGLGTVAIDDSEERAQELYECRVEDVNDTAAVVKLMETMGMEGIIGKYTATITKEDNVQVLSIDMEEAVQASNRKLLDDGMVKCSQQLMALMPSVGKVQWSYSVLSAEAGDETVSVSLNTEEAAEQLGHDIQEYGKSADAFRSLLTQQLGEN